MTLRNAQAEIYAMPLGQVFTFVGYNGDLIKVNAEFYMSFGRSPASRPYDQPKLCAISVVSTHAIVALRGKIEVITEWRSRYLEDD